jgi:predicted nucleic acid-binding protein
MRPIKVLLDANIWVSEFLSRAEPREAPTVSQVLVSQVANFSWGNAPSQLVISHELLDTINRVLIRLGVDPHLADNEVKYLETISRLGPHEEVPQLLLSGRDQLSLHDREDAGVLATAMAGRADILVTRNLSDFVTNDCVTKVTYTGISARGKPTHREVQWHTRSDGVSLIVAHPQDVSVWLDEGFSFEPELLWDKITAVSMGSRPKI